MLIGGSSVSNYVASGNYSTLNSWFETSSNSSSLESTLLGTASSSSSSSLESSLLGWSSSDSSWNTTSDLLASLGYSGNATSLLNLSTGSILDSLG